MAYMFAYGVNTNTDGMALRCPSARIMGPARVDGYAFRFRGHADIERDAASTVIGLLWTIGDGDLAALDRFEGVPFYYIRETVEIHGPGGPCIGYAYAMTEKGPESPPSDAYLEAILCGYRSNGLGDAQLASSLSRMGIGLAY